MKILVTGFKPYQDHATNPSQDLLPLLGDDVAKAVLDVSYSKAPKQLLKAIGESEADAVVILALSPYIDTPAFEQYAYNDMDSPSPDNDGVIKSGGDEIVKGGAPTLLPPFDVATIAQYGAAQGLYGHVSLEPGKYVANQVYYLALSTGTPAVLVHIPQTSKLSLNESLATVKFLIEYIRGDEF